MDRCIERGDIVKVHFVRYASLHRLKVVRLPAGEGDCWELVCENGDPVNVQHFELMELDTLQETTDAL